MDNQIFYILLILVGYIFLCRFSSDLIDYFEIQSVTGLPPGLSWTGDRTPPMRYDEVSPDKRDGCITLCGIPAASGTYTINVNLEIQVSGFIFPTPPIPYDS